MTFLLLIYCEKPSASIMFLYNACHYGCYYAAGCLA